MNIGGKKKFGHAYILLMVGLIAMGNYKGVSMKYHPAD
jgi:hypothetical protein